MDFYLSNKEALGNPCAGPLPVLYYEGSRLNGAFSPFGMETDSAIAKPRAEKSLNGAFSPFGMETHT
jgi:hypothetical protein